MQFRRRTTAIRTVAAWRRGRGGVHLAAWLVAVVASAAVVSQVVFLTGSAFPVRRTARCLRPSDKLTIRHWSLFGWGEDPKEEEEAMDDGKKSRFWSYAEGEGESARLKRDGLRSLLECTETFCLTKHWLPDAFVDSIYNQYAHADGVTLQDFNRLACDGLLLTGKLDEYEKAFDAMDSSGSGLLTRAEIGRLFAGLGRVMAPEELDHMIEEADVGHDGIDFADFLGLARQHLELSEVLRYFETHPQPDSGLPVDTSSPELAANAGLTEVIEVHGEAELNAIVKNGADVVVKLAFTWCRPCKAFWPKYQKYAKVYKDTRFLKVTGNENESCKHYAREVLKAKISPMFAVYSKGELVNTWSGANTGRFIENIEEFLPTAQARASAREAAVAADAELAPSAPAVGKR